MNSYTRAISADISNDMGSVGVQASACSLKMKEGKFILRIFTYEGQGN